VENWEGGSGEEGTGKGGRKTLKPWRNGDNKVGGGGYGGGRPPKEKTIKGKIELGGGGNSNRR